MPRIAVIDPNQLQPMQVLETIDTESILSARMALLKQYWAENDPPVAAQYDVESLEFDPIKIQEEANTYFELLLRDRVNQAARSVTLAYAIGSDLDAIASRYPGGVPRLDGESDDHYRRRIWLSPSTLSAHGTEESYVFWAMTAAAGVLHDASALHLRPSLEVDPSILITGLAMPSPGWELLTDIDQQFAALLVNDPRPATEDLLAIHKYILGESRIGMTDIISVSAPKVYNTDYAVRLWLYPAASSSIVKRTAETNLKKVIVGDYWLGQDHTHMAIDGAVNIPGVHHTEIVSPAADIFVPDDWIVKVNSLTVEIAGTAA